MFQALAMAINIARMIGDLAKQSQGANGSKLLEITNAIGSLTQQGLGMLEMTQRLVEANRYELTPEEEQAVRDADDAAGEVQRRVLAAMNDESGDPAEQARRRDQERLKSREQASVRREGNATEFGAAKKAAEERGKSR